MIFSRMIPVINGRSIILARFISPKKEPRIKINTKNLCLYERMISYYEKNDLKVKDGQIYINGKLPMNILSK